MPAPALVGPGETWPVLLRETNRLFDAPFPETPTFPIPIRPNRADNINAFHPDIQVASARSWTAGVQRALGSNMALEARYVGTRGVNQWSELNYNERNVIENGFLDEFKQAMGNLQRQQRRRRRAGRIVCVLRTGHRHQPAADLSGVSERRRDADNPAAYTGGTATWTNTTLARAAGAHQSEPELRQQRDRARPTNANAAAISTAT